MSVANWLKVIVLCVNAVNGEKMSGLSGRHRVAANRIDEITDFDLRAHNDYPPNVEYTDTHDCPHCKQPGSMKMTHAWEPSLSIGRMKLGFQCQLCRMRGFFMYDMPELAPRPDIYHPVAKFDCPRCHVKVYALWKMRPDDPYKLAMCKSCYDNARRG